MDEAKEFTLSPVPAWDDNEAMGIPSTATEWEVQEIRNAFRSALYDFDDAIGRIVDARERFLQLKGDRAYGNDAQKLLQAHASAARYSACVQGSLHRSYREGRQAEADKMDRED